MGRVRRALRAAIVDVSPLRRHRQLRVLMGAEAVSLLGTMISLVALPYQVFQLTRSSFAVGLLGMAEFVPLVLAATVGGVLADGRDRRRIVMIAQSGRLLIAAGLVANAMSRSPRLWLIFCAAAGGAGLAALERPSLDAVIPRLVARDELGAVAALQGLQGTITMIAGPALGGVIIAATGVRGAYATDVTSFGFSLLAFRALDPTTPARRESTSGVAAGVDGLRYAWSRPELLGTYVVDFAAMFFGMPTALFPALARHLHRGPGALGLLYAAPAMGALVVTVGSGWTGRVRRQGLAVLWAASGWGIAIVAFGFARTLPAAVTFLAIAGAADMVSGLFRMTMWNQTIPDDIRGRAAAVELISYASGPSLGNVEAGAVASLTSVPVAIVSGGVLCVVSCGMVAAALPGMRRFDAGRAGIGYGEMTGRPPLKESPARCSRRAPRG